VKLKRHELFSVRNIFFSAKKSNFFFFEKKSGKNGGFFRRIGTIFETFFGSEGEQRESDNLVIRFSAKNSPDKGAENTKKMSKTGEHFVILSFCHFVILSFRHFVILSFQAFKWLIISIQNTLWQR
jgi:hypothetical protein